MILVYLNNIHFNLLRIKNSNPEESGDISIKEIDGIHKNIENRLDKINLNNIDSSKFKKVFDKNT